MSNLADHLRRDLLAARRSGNRAVAAALRSALAALDNAQAVPVEPVRSGVRPAEALVGVAAADVPRHEIDSAEQRAIVAAELDELHRAVEVYAGREPERAAAAGAGAAALARLLSEASTDG